MSLILSFLYYTITTMAWLVPAIAHDLWQSIPNTFHRTAGNLYDGVAGENGTLTWSWLKNVTKAAWWILSAVNFWITVPALALAGVLKWTYNVATGSGWFIEGVVQPTKWAVNTTLEGFSWTKNGIVQWVKWSAKAVAGVVTAPADIAFWRTRNSTALQPDYNKWVSYTQTATDGNTYNYSTPDTNKTQTSWWVSPSVAGAWWAVAWAAAAANSAKTEKEAKQAQEKADKEIKDTEKKDQAEKKKEEEKANKEETAKTVDELHKQQKSFASKIDWAIKKVQDLSDAEKVAEKQEKFDEQNKFLQEQILDKIPSKKTWTYAWKTFADFAAALPLTSVPNEINNTTTNVDEYNYLKDFITEFKTDISNKLDDNDDLPNLWDNTSRRFETREWKKISSSISDTVEFINDIHRKLTSWQPLKKAHIEHLFYYLWHSTTEDGALQWHIEWTIKDITRLKKERINVEPKHIEKQQEKLIDALNKMKTESWKAVSSIASSSRLWGKKVNKDNASDALEQLADAMNTITEQASAGEKRIDMTKPITGINEWYQSLFSSISSLTN